MRDDPKRYACITLACVPAPYKSSLLSRFDLGSRVECHLCCTAVVLVHGRGAFVSSTVEVMDAGGTPVAVRLDCMSHGQKDKNDEPNSVELCFYWLIFRGLVCV